MNLFKNLLVLAAMVLISLTVTAQDSQSKQSGGANFSGPGTLNIGFTSGFSNNTLGVQADYEIAQLGQDFTVGASLAYQSWQNHDDKNNSLAVGARFRWYADRVLNITHQKWDVFASGDIGFNIGAPNALWWGIGIGGKYHINEKIGLQAIIGSGAQIGIHFNL
ncbi:hypothetical protein EI427_10490 [Flammeovirga pectinis]|uniref:Outer membrane protein beta-barrel domain-containing protein n=1 Tax=Flammeovirga pectinis TaxID=2494373 RepID=A0A3Q9FQV8_9BACT|nr:hypothetical protein [Flammeovirga pectinis]AZQ62648.1 hypothetical protein EI427_10490 [Flammeovirga pectinis]